MPIVSENPPVVNRQFKVALARQRAKHEPRWVQDMKAQAAYFRDLCNRGCGDAEAAAQVDGPEEAEE